MGRKTQTITEQIYNAIREDIFAQRLHFGEKLTTKALQERLGVSSTPIREALTQLQKDGLIVGQPNIGMQVVSYTAKDVLDIYTLMAELDAIALRLACTGSQRDAMVAALEENQAQATQLLTQGDVIGWRSLSDHFHLLFYQYADNSRLSDAADRTRSQVTVFSHAYQQLQMNQHDIQSQHDAILGSLKAGDDVAAEAALRQHSASSLEKALASWENIQQQ